MRWWCLAMALVTSSLAAQEAAPAPDPLYWAVTNNDALELWTLTRDAPPPDQLAPNGLAPSTWAVEQGNAEALQVLIWRGVPLDQVDGAGRNLLFAAAALGRVDLYDRIAAGGANPAQVDEDGNTVVHAAAAAPTPTILHRLLIQGQPVAARNLVGATPLMRACAAGRIDAVRILSAWGAVARDEDYLGRSVRDYAVLGGNADVVAFVENELSPKSTEDDGAVPLPSPE